MTAVAPSISFQRSGEDLAMDVPTTSPAPVESRGARQLLIDRGELRSVLSNLSHELCRPLTSLKAGFDLLLGEPSAGFTPDQRSHILTMVTLCDDLLNLTRSYLDFAGIVQGSRPLCLGRFTISALIQEITRQFGPTAASRQVHWETQVERPGHLGGDRRLPLPADPRQPGVQRTQVHAGRRTSARHGSGRFRFLDRGRR